MHSIFHPPSKWDRNGIRDFSISFKVPSNILSEEKWLWAFGSRSIVMLTNHTNNAHTHTSHACSAKRTSFFSHLYRNICLTCFSEARCVHGSANKHLLQCSFGWYCCFCCCFRVTQWWPKIFYLFNKVCKGMQLSTGWFNIRSWKSFVDGGHGGTTTWCFSLYTEWNDLNAYGSLEKTETSTSNSSIIIIIILVNKWKMKTTP